MIFGVGTDICQIDRIEAAITKHGDRFAERVLHPNERHSVISATFLAKRFAAKEAIAKALGCGIGEKLSFHDAIITREEGQRPLVKLSENAQANFPDIHVHLSLSDDGAYAQAFAVAEQKQ